jgi:hypothetical protein
VNQPVSHGDLPGCPVYCHGPVYVIDGHLLDIPCRAKHSRDLLKLLPVFLLREPKYPIGLPEGHRYGKGHNQEPHNNSSATYDGRRRQDVHGFQQLCHAGSSFSLSIDVLPVT